MKEKTGNLITLTNDFHNTSIRVIASPGYERQGQVLPDLILSARQVQKCRRTLCGIADCTCGGSLGERGAQDFNCQSYNIQPLADGRAIIHRR